MIWDTVGKSNNLWLNNLVQRRIAHQAASNPLLGGGCTIHSACLLCVTERAHGDDDDDVSKAEEEEEGGRRLSPLRLNFLSLFVMTYSFEKIDVRVAAVQGRASNLLATFCCS